MKTATTVRSETRRQVVKGQVWETTICGYPWWGNLYMALRGTLPWDGVVNHGRTALANTRAFRAAMLRDIREFNRGEADAVTLGAPYAKEFPDGSGSAPVRRAHLVGNGRLVKMLHLDAGAAAVNGRKAAFVEREIGPGDWFLGHERTKFLYVREGRVRAVLMGLRRERCQDADWGSA